MERVRTAGGKFMLDVHRSARNALDRPSRRVKCIVSVAIAALLATGVSAPASAEETGADEGVSSSEPVTDEGGADSETRGEASEPADLAATGESGGDSAAPAEAEDHAESEAPAETADPEAPADPEDPAAPAGTDLRAAIAAAAGGAPGTGTASPRSKSAYAKGLREQHVTLTEFPTNNAPSSGQRMTKVQISRNLTSKRVSARVTFAATPSASTGSVVLAFVGVWSGNTCTPRLALLADAVGGSAQAGFLNSNGEVTSMFAASRSRSGKVLSMKTAARSTIRSASWTCGYAVNEAASGTPIYTASYGENLKNTMNAKFKMKIAGKKQVAAKGKRTRLGIVVRNTGGMKATHAKLVIKTGKGLKVSKKVAKIGTVKAGKKTKKVLVTVKNLNGKTGKLRATVVAKGVKKVSKVVKITVKPKPKHHKPPKSLKGKYYWGFKPSMLSDYSGWVTTGMYFANSKYVFVGEPKKGKFPKCAKSGKGCKRYHYNKRTGRVKIGKQKMNVKSGSFRYAISSGGAKYYFEIVTLPRKGTKLSADLLRKDWWGNCMITCTTSTNYLRLWKNGRFLRGGSYVGSWPGLGSNWAGTHADQIGNYRIVKKGVILLHYKSGKKEYHVIGINHTKSGHASASKAGVVLDTTNYYR